MQSNKDKNMYKSFNIYKAIILIFMICLILLMSQKTKLRQTTRLKIVEENQQTFFKPLDIIVPNSLKTNFINGTNYCKTQNIAQNGAFENCVLYYIYERSKTDHGIILNINTYCSKTTTNECDRRNCVEEYLLSD